MKIKLFKNLKGRWTVYVKRFTADFETATWLEDETYVWAWATCEIGKESNMNFGNSISSFIDFIKSNENSYWYFHNLKFDGEFIIYWLEKNGFKWIKDKKDIDTKTYSTLISEMGQFYSITIYFKKYKNKVIKATFIDSLKILPFSVQDIAKSFGLPIQKLELDYNKPRPKNHKLTKDEKEYITNDVLIIAKALKTLFDDNLKKMTQGSNALCDFKEIIGINKFNHFFPVLDNELDKNLRNSYKGGFTYLNPLYKEKEVGVGCVLDVNSLYPYVMYSKKLPFYEPIFYEGKYKEDKVYDLYIQYITCSFKLKKNKIPIIQIKKSISFMPNHYLENSNDEIVTLALTNIDLKLFLEQYKVENLEYHYGWKFKSISGIFNNYIDKWLKLKNEGTKTGNKSQRTRAKLMLNSLYGKFSTAPFGKSKVPFLGEDDIVHYKIGEEEERKKLYIPIGSFITSYAREKTIRTAQLITDYSISKYGIDKFIYSDTDSIHTLLSIEELKQLCEIDDIKLGAWKHESTFTKGKYIRQKCYIEEIDNKIQITCAGMPTKCYEDVTWENFKTGFTSDKKLTFKHVKGGVKLVNTDFTIKEEKIIKSVNDLLKEKGNDKK